MNRNWKESDGKWVGPVDEAQLPVEMEIDWVRFYK